jgi:hypothetical protein
MLNKNTPPPEEAERFSATAQSGLFVDPVQSNLAVGYGRQELIGDLVAPPTTVDQQAGKYKVLGLENRDIVSDVRGPRGEYNAIQIGWSVDTYSCVDRGLEFPIDQGKYRAGLAAGGVGDMLEMGRITIMDMMLLAREARIATAMTTAGNFTLNTALAGADQWSHADSDPKYAIQTYKSAVQAATGFDPNELIIGKAVKDALVNHPMFKELFKNTGTLTTLQLLANVFELEKIHVGAAVYNTAKQGQTRSMGYVWGKNAVLICNRPGPISEASPKVCQQMRWMADTEGQPLVVERYDSNERRSHIVRVRSHQDEKIVGGDFGYLIATAVA